MKYQKIIKNNSKILVVNKSKFINHTFIVNCMQDVQHYLKTIKAQYCDATHVCYAYQFLKNNSVVAKYDEDNEPSGSSGLQIYHLIQKKNLINVLIIVIRYFGVSKLGIGLLSRSYLNCAKLCVNDLNLEPYLETIIKTIKIKIQSLDQVLKIIKQNHYELVQKRFDDLTVFLTLKIPLEQSELIRLKKYEIK